MGICFFVESPRWVSIGSTCFTNACTDVDVQAEVEWQWRLKMLDKTPKELRELGTKLIRPLLLIFKRFDFRAAPRWRSQRWKAKT